VQELEEHTTLTLDVMTPDDNHLMVETCPVKCSKEKVLLGAINTCTEL
jgi:hypothetical protein